jgi:hypothetical protein
MATRIRRPKPNTRPAETAKQALDNVHIIMSARSSGWDRQVTREIIKFVYGDTEAFVREHLGVLEYRAKLAEAS